MVVVVVLLAVVDTDVPELGSLSIAVLWSLNSASAIFYSFILMINITFKKLSSITCFFEKYGPL